MSKLSLALRKLWHGTGPSSPLYVASEPSRPPQITFTSIASLSDALIRAKNAHVEYERGLGRADTNWPLWYAGYMALEQAIDSALACQPAAGCGLSRVRAQVKSPSIEKVESTLVNLASEEEYWQAH